MENKGKVYLVGAGPGDYKLITLKGKECIEKANVIIYDRLVNKRLLQYANSSAELIYVGKSPERHTLLQNEINDLIVKKGLEGKIVTRLKGGDPFVFGRGGEEALALKENNIPFEIVPGITSAISVPAYAGIPVTHRGITSNVGFITGNEDPSKENSNIQWDKIATGMGTLVFLMGMNNLPKITSKLIENGRSKNTPVALIYRGTLPQQRTLVGTLDNIVMKAKAENFKNPAIIIVGEVVNLRKDIKWLEDKPLFGKTVLVTRARTQASAFSELIEELGGEAIEFPTIEISPPDNYISIDKAIMEIDSYSWVIFTSVNGVKFFFDRLRKNNKDVRCLNNARLVAIGPKTKDELEKYGLIIDFVPNEYRAEALIEGFKNENISGQKILLPRADIARKILPEKLSEMGAIVDEVTAYKTTCADNNKTNIADLFTQGKIDFVTFTSSSTVKNFVTVLKEYDLEELLKDVKLASIGPITTQTASKCGLDIDIEAEEYTLNGLLHAIINYVN